MIHQSLDCRQDKHSATNNRCLLCVFPEYAKQPKRNFYRGLTPVVGTQAVWSTPESKAKFYKDMPFKVKMFHKIHTMVHHGAIGGQTKAWERAAKRIEAKMPLFECQKEWY